MIPTVATGIDFGICTIENNASRPSIAPLQGTPMTGITVCEAITPGRCAARPAPAIITSQPSASISLKVSSNFSGTLWADKTYALYEIPLNS